MLQTISLLLENKPGALLRVTGLLGCRGYNIESLTVARTLDPELSRPVGKYSQGMRQRMSLARAILQDPRILLLDEPFSNVDVHSAREMVGLLAGMRDAGKTIFVVTHQAALLEGVADEFVWMQAGQIVDRTASLTRASAPSSEGLQ